MKKESEAHAEIRPESVRTVRLGHGANCSSLGSIIDTLFATAVVGTALFAGVIAALSKEPVTIVAHDEDPDEADPRVGPPT